MLSFQKPGPLILEWRAILISIKELSVLYPAEILADLTLHIKLSVMRKKSRRH